jgi:hypothetical protein
MGYPEKGADYHHKPKWLGDMKRAEGGEVDGPITDTSPMAVDSTGHGLPMSQREAALSSQMSNPAQTGLAQGQENALNTPLRSNKKGD